MFWKLKKEKFLMPAEWERHSATWLAWPNDDDYFGERMKRVENIYLEIIKALHSDELIKLLVPSKEKEEKVKGMLKTAEIDLTQVIFYQADYVDVWMRDYGPIFVKKEDGGAWIKWEYDGYGGKFPELLPDNKVFLNLKNFIKHKMVKTGFVLEGGAIDSNGQGVFLTTKECLIEKRNLGETKEENERMLGKFLGAKKVLWLNKGLVNDHTDGHIDEVARFMAPDKILCSFEENPADENFSRLKENLEILENATDENGNKFGIIKIPLPHMYYEKVDKEFGGKKAPVSYVNFYIGNKTVLVSLFDDPNDGKALEIIKACFPGKEVVGINCRDLIYGGGAIHCITGQEPLI